MIYLKFNFDSKKNKKLSKKIKLQRHQIYIAIQSTKQQQHSNKQINNQNKQAKTI